MRTDELREISDHLHDEIGVSEEGRLEATTNVDDFYDEIDRNVFGVEEEESTVSFADMTAALSLIVGWCCDSKDVRHVGGKICALQVLLDPVNAKHGRIDLASIAREIGCTRAAISKWVVEFRDQVGTSLTVGKRSSVRETNRRAQNAAFAMGTHAGQVRKAKRAAIS